ncbi:protein kinase [Kineococcus sp. NBC_00420]|uniref:protein kinase domain-containing protein n=1 Tax=Kineococcus sp. NBC_00420 TaxID=2903564 RepID=UPI002E1EC882
MERTGPGTQTAPARQWRREALAALGDDPRRRAPEVDGYRIDRLLGAGGSSVVWAGTGVDDVERALKVLHPGGSGDLLAELSMLRRVRHPRVVAVHDISTDAEGRPVLVLDLAVGGSLAALVAQRRRLSAGEVSGLLAVLGPALEDLHAAGVVHGDIAPGNVLLDARGEPLLADLGVSRALGRQHGSVLGTPGFADPTALGGGGVGAASDVYGLAALGWWALTGEVPARAGALGARSAVRRAAADLPPGSSAVVLAALQEGLHRSQSRRPTPGELAAAVSAASRPRAVRGLTPSAAPAAPRRVPGTPAPVVPPPPGATRQLSETAPPPVSARPSPATPTVRRRAVPARPPRRRAGGGTRGVRLPLVAGGVVLVVGAGAFALSLRGDGSGSSAPASPVASAAAPDVAAPVAGKTPAAPVGETPAVIAGADVLRGVDPVAVVTELADRRASALSSGEAGALDRVDVPGSSAAATDRAVLDDLARAGTTLTGLGFAVSDVRVESRTEEQWTLSADVVTSAHETVAADGARTSVPQSAPRTSRLILDRVEGEWRISAVG